MFDDFSGRLSCSCDGFGESESKKPEHTFLQISRQQFGVDSLIIVKFIALRMEMVRFSGSKPLNSSLVDRTYECKTRQNATLTCQDRQGDVQLKVC